MINLERQSIIIEDEEGIDFYTEIKKVDDQVKTALFNKIKNQKSENSPNVEFSIKKIQSLNSSDSVDLKNKKQNLEIDKG